MAAGKKKRAAGKKKAASPKRAAGKKKAASPKRAAGKKKAASPKRATNQKKAASPKKATNQKKAGNKKKAASPPRRADSLYAPAKFLAYDNGGFGLFFSCDEFDAVDAERLFSDAGSCANGYGWEGVLAPALEARDPEAARAVSYDCEADTFVAHADTEAPLQVLAAVIREVTATAEALSAALVKRDPERD
jgi:hypothetical protein